MTSATSAATATAHHHALDLGCGAGIVTRALLDAYTSATQASASAGVGGGDGGLRVMAVDMAEEHLELVRQAVAAGQRPYLATKCGRFPDGFTFPPDSFQSILASHVLHFLEPEDFREGVRKLWAWTAPGGKVFVQVRRRADIPVGCAVSHATVVVMMPRAVFHAVPRTGGAVRQALRSCSGGWRRVAGVVRQGGALHSRQVRTTAGSASWSVESNGRGNAHARVSTRGV